MENEDPYDIQRFITAQDKDYAFAIAELNRGKKESHWMWYVFPQLAGLGTSQMALDYAITCRKEAETYLDHPVLVQRLQECCEALLRHKASNIEDIMGFPDNLKLWSSMTLFASVSPNPWLFQAVIDTFYRGLADEKTVSLLASTI